MLRISRVLALTVFLVLVFASSAFATDRYASPTGSGSTCSSGSPCTLATAVSNSAASGDRVLLKSGNFGTFLGGSKTSLTITKDTGATPTLDFDFDGNDTGFIFDNITIAGGTLFCSSCTTPQLKFTNDTFTSNVVLNSNTGMTNAGDHDAILFDGDHFDTATTCVGSNAKIHLSYTATAHSGVTIQNSTFKNGDCDGVHTGTGVDVLNNEFSNLCDTGGNHTDNIQTEGMTGGRIAGNWVHEGVGCTTQGITSYDGGTHSVLIENNVVDIRRQWGIEWYKDDGSTIQHNTVVYHGGSCYGSNPCGEISIDTKDTCPSSTTVNDNIATVIGGSCPISHTKNMVPSGATGTDFNGTPTFVGGATPTTYADFALTCASAGHNAASDGTNVGAITGGEPNCTPSPFVNDTFTGTTGTTLISHTGETGATWTRHSTFSSAQLTAGGRLRPSSTSIAQYYSSGTPTNANYKVEADFYVGTHSDTNLTGLACRLDTSQNTMYYGQWSSSSGAWKIQKAINNTFTALNTGSAYTLVDGNTYAVEFDCNGTSLTLKVNGVTQASATDSSITAAGRAGLRMNQGANLGDSNGVQLDNFKATDL